MKCSLCHERRTRKNFESPAAIGPTTSQTPGGLSNHWATRTYGEQGLESHQGLRFFPSPIIVTWWMFHLSHIYPFAYNSLKVISASLILRFSFPIFRLRGAPAFLQITESNSTRSPLLSLLFSRFSFVDLKSEKWTAHKHFIFAGVPASKK